MCFYSRIEETAAWRIMRFPGFCNIPALWVQLTHHPNKGERPNDAGTTSISLLHDWKPLTFLMSWGFTSFSFLSSSSTSLVFPVECGTCARVCAAFVPRREASLKDPGPPESPCSFNDVQPLCECTSVTLSSFDPLCCSSFFFFFFSCDKCACPLDPPGGLRMAVSHEPFWQAHFEGFRMWWRGS